VEGAGTSDRNLELLRRGWITPAGRYIQITQHEALPL